MTRRSPRPHARSLRRHRLLALAVVPLLLLAACGGQQGTNGSGSGAGSGSGSGGAAVQSSVDVDTPQLRALKRQAGVETCPRPQQPASAVPGGLPAVELPCLGGGPAVRLDALRGPLVINLWAQWCGPCREELPFYQQLHEKARGKLQVIGIDYQDTQPAAALQLVKQSGVTYPLLADPDATVRVPFRTRALPGIILVDAQGRVTHLEYIAFRSYAELKGMVQQYLGLTP